MENFVLYGYTSTAETYASLYNIKYIDARISKCKVSIPNSGYYYNSKGVKPAVTVRNANGDKLKQGTDYSVSYANNKKCGKATVTVTGKGKYTGTSSLTFIIKPAKVKIVSAKSPKAKQVKAVWKKSAGGVSGYHVQVALDKKFKKSAKLLTVKKPGAAAKTVTGLKSKKIYYVRVRAFKTVNKTRYAGKWSAVKTVKCK